MDISLIIQIFILLALIAGIYLYFFRRKPNQDEQVNMSPEFKTEINDAIQKNFIVAADNFIKLADQNLKRHNQEAQTNFQTNSEKVEKDVKSLKDEMGSLGKSLTEAVQNVKSSGTDLGSFSFALHAHLTTYLEVDKYQ